MSQDPSRWNAAIIESRGWRERGFRLERAHGGSVLHQLLDAWQQNDLIEGKPTEGFDAEKHFADLLDHPFHSFVCQHDWAAAFRNSDVNLVSDDNVVFRQPYEHCVFEFAVSGRRVCLISNFNGSTYTFAAFVRLEVGWFAIGLRRWPEFSALHDLLRSQHAAMMVALDAKVIETPIVRAPEKLNRARRQRGKVPVFDYHIVELAHRTRPASLPPENESDRASPRLHFRRGHWRHFEAFKTWINWMLVGDPDLGFIDKHYRL
jgi:hypothetical protein